MTEFYKRLFTSTILLLLLYFSFFSDYLLFLTLFFLFYFSFIEAKNIGFKIFYKKKDRFLFLIFSLIILLVFCLIVWLLVTKDSNSKNIILFFLCICISTDIGGYIFGKVFKGKKLTSISPNKTYSGMFGSFLLSILSSFMFINIISLNINIFIISLIISFTSQIGDLFFSFLKRKAKIEDTGNILPGHGGILDRIDGIIFGIPVGYIFYLIN